MEIETGMIDSMIEMKDDTKLGTDHTKADVVSKCQ